MSGYNKFQGNIPNNAALTKAIVNDLMTKVLKKEKKWLFFKGFFS